MMRLWHLFQRCRRFITSALWVVPFSAIVLELIVYRLVRALDDTFAWQLQRFSAAGAQALLETIITMTLSFVVFTFGSLLVAIGGRRPLTRHIATTLLRTTSLDIMSGCSFSPAVCDLRSTDKGDGRPVGPRCGCAARPALDGGLSLLNRLCSTTAAARQYSVPGRRRWPWCDRGCLSSTGTRSIAAAHQGSD